MKRQQAAVSLHPELFSRVTHRTSWLAARAGSRRSKWTESFLSHQRQSAARADLHGNHMFSVLSRLCNLLNHPPSAHTHTHTHILQHCLTRFGLHSTFVPCLTLVFFSFLHNKMQTHTHSHTHTHTHTHACSSEDIRTCLSWLPFKGQESEIQPTKNI